MAKWKPWIKIKLRGKPWIIKVVKDLKKGYCGVCWHSDKIIEVETAEGPKKTMDIVIHECLHGYFPDVREFHINRSATEIADALWKLGYRKVK